MLSPRRARTPLLAGALLGNVVTGGEKVGDRVVLRTYDQVLVYTPPEPRARHWSLFLMPSSFIWRMVAPSRSPRVVSSPQRRHRSSVNATS